MADPYATWESEFPQRLRLRLARAARSASLARKFGWYGDEDFCYARILFDLGVYREEVTTW